MEISTLTAFITPFLPFLLKLGKTATETATESAASKFGEAAWQKAQTVWTALSPQVHAKETVKEAITDAANNPEDEDYQAALRVQLKKLLASDAALANQLTQILQSDTSQSIPTTQITQNVKGNQNQTIGQVSGGQVFGNVTGSVITSGSGNSVTFTPTRSSSQKPPSPVKTILVLAANPTGTSRLRLGEEVREIQAGLDRSQHRDRFRIEQRWAVRPRDIQRALLDCRPHIVHFSGHGVGVASSSSEPDNTRKATVVSLGENAQTTDAQTAKVPTTGEPEGLLFEDVSGQSKLVSTDAIARLFSLFSDEIECVVLNACYSAVQADAIAQHIPYVIGMKKAIGDRAAIQFSIGFYDALLAGRTVEFAYQLGRNGIELENIPEHLTPIMKKHRS